MDLWENEFKVVEEIIKYLLSGKSHEMDRNLRLAIKHGSKLEPVLNFHTIRDFRELGKNGFKTSFSKLLDTQWNQKEKFISNDDLDKCIADFDAHSHKRTLRLAIWIIRCGLSQCSHRLDVRLNTTRLVSDEINLLFIIFTDDNLYKFTGSLNIHNILKLDETLQIETNQLGIKLCGKCKEGWIHYRSKQKPVVHSCYYVGKERFLSENKAINECKAKHSTLVNVETYEELNFIEKLLKKKLRSLKPQNENREIMIHIGAGLHEYFLSNKRPRLFLYKKPRDVKFTITIYSGMLVPDRAQALVYFQSNGGGIYSRFLFSEGTFLEFCEEFVGDTSLENKLESNIQPCPINKGFLFECKDSNNNYIHYNQVCDGVIHCENARDEEYCMNDSEEHKDGEFMCKKHNYNFPSVKTIPKNAVCDRKHDCLDGSDETDCNSCNERQCSDGTCLPKYWLNDWNTHCQYKLESDLANDSFTYPRQLLFGVSICNQQSGKWAPRCVHLRENNGKPIGCRDYSHLKNCEDFTCTTGLVKCPHSFCIPIHYLQDNMMDCVYGEDESNDVIIDDANLRMCLRNNPRVNICDGKTECDNLADELDCHTYCAAGFKCRAGVVKVDDYNKSEPFSYLSRFDGRTQVFLLSGVDLSFSSNERIHKFHQLLEVHVSKCCINEDQMFDFIKTNQRLYTFDASYNNIINITNNGMFSKLRFLKFLNLSHNTHLNSIDPDGIASEFFISLDISFTKISFLQEKWLKRSRINELYLQHTRIYSLQWLPANFQLTHLNIQNTLLQDTNIHSNYFKNATITGRLFADNYKLCCPLVTGPGIPQHVCGLADDVISSCDDLIGDMVKRTMLWTMAITALVGNAAVIIFRAFFNRAMFKLSYGIFVTSLGVADFIMGVYLLIIASVDIFYRGVYVLHENGWRLSPLCKFSGFLSTLSSESSVFFVSLITLDRFLAMRFPFGQHKFTKISVSISTVLSWTFAFLIALIPIIYPEWLIYSSNGMCLGLPLTGSGEPGWMYSMAVFIILNFVMFILIVIGQVAIYRSLGDRKKLSIPNQSRRENDIDVARQLFIIAVTDFLCWFPISVLGLLSIKGQIVSREMYAWLIVFVLPLNSAVNPMIYTVPMIYKKWVEFREGCVKSFPLKDCFTRDIDILAVLNSDYDGFTEVEEALDFQTVEHIYLRQRFAPRYRPPSKPNEYIGQQFTISDNDLDKCIHHFNQNSPVNTTRLVFWVVQCGPSYCSHSIDQNIDTTKLISDELNALFLIINNRNLKQFSGHLRLNNVLELSSMIRHSDSTGNVFEYERQSNRIGLKLCGQCMAGWVKFESKKKPFVRSCYHLRPKQESYRDFSQYICKNKFSNVVNIESNEESNFLTELLSERNNTKELVGTPLSRDAFYVNIYLEKNFHHWSNKRPVITNFHAKKSRNEIDKSFSEKCMVLKMEEHLLPNSTSVSKIYPFLEIVSCKKFLESIPVCEIDFLGNWTHENEFDMDDFESDLRVINVSFLFACDESGQYIHYNEVCDGSINCKYARDEKYCLHDKFQSGRKGLKCKVYSFGYLSDAVIPEEYICNGREDCFDGSDEVECDPCNEMKCSDGTCLPKHWFDQKQQMPIRSGS
ncbi:hypothetical protein Btru_051140 [Bulinus truncatus]|nr:hypothetical protein Btru_051140 [Bulinus truncatus]